MKKQKRNLQFYKETPEQRLNRVRNEGNSFRPRSTPTRAEYERKQERKNRQKLRQNFVQYDEWTKGSKIVKINYIIEGWTPSKFEQWERIFDYEKRLQNHRKPRRKSRRNRKERRRSLYRAFTQRFRCGDHSPRGRPANRHWTAPWPLRETPCRKFGSGVTMWAKFSAKSPTCLLFLQRPYIGAFARSTTSKTRGKSNTKDTTNMHEKRVFPKSTSKI